MIRGALLLSALVIAAVLIVRRMREDADTLTDATMRNVRETADRAARIRDLTEQTRPRRSIVDGPPTRAYRTEVPRT